MHRRRRSGRCPGRSECPAPDYLLVDPGARDTAASRHERGQTFGIDRDSIRRLSLGRLTPERRSMLVPCVAQAVERASRPPDDSCQTSRRSPGQYALAAGGLADQDTLRRRYFALAGRPQNRVFGRTTRNTARRRPARRATSAQSKARRGAGHWQRALARLTPRRSSSRPARRVTAPRGGSEPRRSQLMPRTPRGLTLRAPAP